MNVGISFQKSNLKNLGAWSTLGTFAARTHRRTVMLYDD